MFMGACRNLEGVETQREVQAEELVDLIGGCKMIERPIKEGGP